MNKKLQKIKNKLIVALWENEKADLTMQEIGEIFRVSTTAIFKILKRSEKNKD
jgi:predicted DNA-binding protein YlxM (UPF0122 family)